MKEIIARHLSFWTLENVDRPLIGANVEPAAKTESRNNRAEGEGNILRPDQCLLTMDPVSRFQEHQEQMKELDTDLFRSAAPPLAGLWMEAALGMPLKSAGGSIWPLPLLAENEPLENLHITVRDEWIEAIAHGTDRLAQQIDGRYPMMGPWMRAPVDMVTSLMGTSRACLELHDHPDEMLELIKSITDTWCQVASTLQSHVPSWEGGFVLSAANGIYAPGPAAVFSEDSTVLISRSDFRHFFLPADKRLSQTFPYGMVHRHAASLHNITDLLEIEPNWLIQIALDQMGPTVVDLMPVFHQLQEAGRPFIVYIYGLRTDRNPEEQILSLARELSPEGLCLIIHTDNIDSAKHLIRVAKTAWSG